MEYIKKTWFLFVVILGILCWGVYTRITATNTERRYRTVEAELIGLREKISGYESLVGQLQQHNSELTAISARWTERDKILGDIYKELATGNRRQEEIARSLTGAIVGLKGGLSTIDAAVTKLGKDNTNITAELAGSSELIQQSLAIIQRLQAGSR